MHPLFDDFFLLNSKLWLITQHQNLPIYDFDFARYFPLHRPVTSPGNITAIARIGGFGDYEQHGRDLLALGISLIHSPEQHHRCSELHLWYPLFHDLTPKSIVFDGPPDIDRISHELGWPIFMKGSRQTSRHKKSLSIIQDPDHLRRALEQYQQDDILHWQQLACRQFVPLRKIEDIEHQDRLPSSFEFRTFWWKNNLVGFGRYWWGGKDYTPTPAERSAAIDLAAEAARRINVPFLVIECNDAQESGYAGVHPVSLWQNILDLESPQ